MRLDELKGKKERHSEDTLSRLRALAHTKQYKYKVSRAIDDTEVFMNTVKYPAVSCGGGKDGTAAAIIARLVNPSIPIYHATPPNPLPGREMHLRILAQHMGGEWREVDYWWDVEAVLNGHMPYPHELKIKKLREAMAADGIDGVIMGVRMAESKGRTINGYIHGTVYQLLDKTWRCLPVLRWTAEETLALSLFYGVPINPVYKQDIMLSSLEYLRDGTWWPHGVSSSHEFGEWIKFYYPELLDKYRIAERIMDGENSPLCLI